MAATRFFSAIPSSISTERADTKFYMYSLSSSSASTAFSRAAFSRSAADCTSTTSTSLLESSAAVGGSLRASTRGALYYGPPAMLCARSSISSFTLGGSRPSGHPGVFAGTVAPCVLDTSCCERTFSLMNRLSRFRLQRRSKLGLAMLST
jgi:hypothetical protein